jgi:hypothetical protein
MTNLQGPSKGVKLPISPEQALVVLPALGGVVLAAVVAGSIKSQPEFRPWAGSRQPSSARSPLMSWERAARPSVMDQKSPSRRASDSGAVL